MKHLKSVEFVFENTEFFEIDEKYFGTFHISKLERCINRIACNAISEATRTDEVVLEIYVEGDDTYFPFGDKEMKTTKFDRLSKYNDITLITLKYEDGSTDELYPIYDDGDDDDNANLVGAPNKNQHSKFSELGNLYITIGNNLDIDKVFKNDEINDDELIRYHKVMQDVIEPDEFTKAKIKKMVEC